MNTDRILSSCSIYKQKWRITLSIVYGWWTIWQNARKYLLPPSCLQLKTAVFKRLNHTFLFRLISTTTTIVSIILKIYIIFFYLWRKWKEKVTSSLTDERHIWIQWYIHRIRWRYGTHTVVKTSHWHRIRQPSLTTGEVVNDDDDIMFTTSHRRKKKVFIYIVCRKAMEIFTWDDSWCTELAQIVYNVNDVIFTMIHMIRRIATYVVCRKERKSR